MTVGRPTTTWALRFCRDFSDEEIDAKTAVGVPSLPDLAGLRVEVARSILDSALQQLFVPSAQTRSVLRELQALCRCYSAKRYPDELTFLRNVYASDREHATFEPQLRVTCLTGLPGVGKSAVISAFARLSGPEKVAVDGHGTVDLQPTWRMSAKSGSGLRQLVLHLFRNPESVGARTLLFTTIQRELCTQGVASIHADELQFLTQGEGNALPAKLLNSLARLGPPLVYVANFSLLHRLNSRPQEEKQRLLVRPLFMHPDVPGSNDWHAFLASLFDAVPAFAELTADKVGHLLYAYTFGIRRLVVILMIGAYVAMRARDACAVTVADIDYAYGAPDYSSCRRDVEVLLARVERNDNRRKDLWCPLPDAMQTRGRTTVVQHPAVKEYERRTAEAALAASLTPSEHRCANSADKEHAVGLKPRKPPKQKATVEDLLEGAVVLQDGRKPRTTG